MDQQTPFSWTYSIGIQEEIEVYLYIWDDLADIYDLEISVETNDNTALCCFSGVLVGIAVLGGLPLGIVFLVLFLRRKGPKDIEKDYTREIRNLEKKIKEMEELGIDTKKEKKLLEEYKRAK
jgi:hypothetical protein